jgi:hypothetical protein
MVCHYHQVLDPAGSQANVALAGPGGCSSPGSSVQLYVGCGLPSPVPTDSQPVVQWSAHDSGCRLQGTASMSVRVHIYQRLLSAGLEYLLRPCSRPQHGLLFPPPPMTVRPRCKPSIQNTFSSACASLSAPGAPKCDQSEGRHRFGGQQTVSRWREWCCDPVAFSPASPLTRSFPNAHPSQ